MYILGISCFYHDSSACLIKDGQVIAAVQEERFNRDKFSPVFPIQAINYCLQEAGITSCDVEHIAFYEKMYLKFERTVLAHLYGYPFTLHNFLETMPLWLKDRLGVPYIIKEELSYKGKIWHVKHHLSHAASAFFVSPFEKAAILTVDGVGEYASSTYGVGDGRQMKILKEILYPHSLGLLYSMVTVYLGFHVFSGEGKIMALAEFGKPTYMDQFREVVDVRPDGSFRMNLRYFSLNRAVKMHSGPFVRLLGPPRKEGEEITGRHRDIAASLQRLTEDILLKMTRHVYQETRMENLCLAGGVFLNVTANSRIFNETPFKNLFIQPAAGDAGASLGAAAYVCHALLDQPRTYVMRSSALGPRYSDKVIETLISNEGEKFKRLSDEYLPRYVAQVIADDKIVGWFQGRMEFGPRSLGHRSILADPRNPDMKDIINAKVKHRESFRPFGVSVLREDAGDYFDLSCETPFMLLVARVKKEKARNIPAVIHVNNTSRIQTVTKKDNGIYYDLISAFKAKTGVPMILNTSFNDKEPIVCTPQEAYQCYKNTSIDCLVMGNYVVEKDEKSIRSP
jgi:carbamoyltransferase